MRQTFIKGFTLIEVMLTLVVLALLVSLTPPLFQKAFPSLKLKAATRDLAQEIRYIQQTAILTGVPSKVQFDLQNNAYQSDHVNGGEVRHLPDGLNFASDNSRSSAIGESVMVLEFFPDGSSSGGLLILDNGGRRFAISVDWLTSRVRVVDPQELKANEPLQV
ncbi:GspH/FimT family pseudopilin [Candidatus Thiodiazotropha sp. CDECU1]|uniref:GspH/FimT family pseudopilin n=1 Tax=Candidatus Thiodiazotropha sp. CDECU1 TaxID=3065865 RepID=UPI00292FD547|nr:GspH/FimT family pseudopilin [Candidatus Thiodiazotropha sp. CDECU1]